MATRKKTIAITKAFAGLRGECSICKHWEANEDKEAGFCHRYPPKVMEVDNELDTVWVITLPEEWCGEFGANQ